MSTEGNVKVALRIRPLIGRERIEGENASAIRIPDSSIPQVVMGKDKVFTYDYVFSSASNQIQVFEECVVPLVDSFVLGFNSTILAYGQTGSGKTYTVATGGVPPVTNTPNLPGNKNNSSGNPSSSSSSSSSLSLSSPLDSSIGIIPRAIERIYGYLRHQYDNIPGYQGEVKVQFLEIYGEDVRDLLNNTTNDTTTDTLNNVNNGIINANNNHNHNHNRGNNGNSSIGNTSLSVRETDQGVTVIGATDRKCTTAQDMLQLLYEGSLHRQTGATLMNTHSSRSHAIFTIILDQRLPHNTNDDTAPENITTESTAEDNSKNSSQHPKKKHHHHHHSKSKSTDDTGPSMEPVPMDALEHRVSKFHLLDLAGSERIKRTQAVGKRMQEGIHINLGLLALGNVISALGDDERKKKGGALPHIPYRDSKLTFILKDSLGGNSKTLMVACVSPADSNFDESLNTLRYAARARNIKNKPVINRDSNTGIITALRNEIAALKAQLTDHHQRSSNHISPELSSTNKLSLQALLDIVHETDVQQALEKVTELQSVAEDAEELRTQIDNYTEQNLSLRKEIQRLLNAHSISDDERSKIESKLYTIQDFIQTKLQNIQQYSPTEQQTIREISTYILRILKNELNMVETEQLVIHLHELERELAKYKAIVRQEYSDFYSDPTNEKNTVLKKTRKLNPSLVIGLETLQTTNAAFEPPDNDRNNDGLPNNNATDNDEDDTENITDDINRDPIITAAMKNFGISEEEILEALHINDSDDEEVEEDENQSLHESTGNDTENLALDKSNANGATTHKQHRQRQLMMRGHIQEINDNIDAKERLQSALYAKQTELEQIRKSYEDRFTEERTAKQLLESRIQQLRKQLHQTSTLNQEEKLIMETKLHTSLDDYEQKLRESNAKLRDYDNFLKLRKRTETELYKLQDELSDLRKAKIAQIAVMKAERTKYEREHQIQLRKISKLEKEKALISNELAKVKDEELKKDVLLKHKQEDLVITKRKLRELTSNDIVTNTSVSQKPPTRKSVVSGRKSIISNGILDPTRQRVVAAVAKSVTAVRKKSRLSQGNTVNKLLYPEQENTVPPSSTETDESNLLRKQLEKAALRIAEKEQRVEELERRLRARETDVRILEQLIEARDRIRQSMLVMNTSPTDNGNVSVASSVSDSVTNSSRKAKLHHLVYDEVDRESGIDQALLDDINAFFATSSLGNNSYDRTKTLSNQASTAAHAIPRHDNVLTDTMLRNNVLVELETRIETAQARIEYQDERILGLADDDEDIVADVLENVTKNIPSIDNENVSQPDNENSKRSIPLPLSLVDAQLQIKVLFDMIVNAKTEDRNHFIALENEKEKNRILQDTIAANEAVIKGIRLESDRKIDEVKRQAVNEADLLLRLGDAARSSSSKSTESKDNDHSVLTDTNQSAQLISMLQSARQKLSTMEEKLSESEKEKERLIREIHYLRKKQHPTETHGSYTHHHQHHYHHQSYHSSSSSSANDTVVSKNSVVVAPGKTTKTVSAAPPKVPSGPTSASARLSTSSVTSSSSSYNHSVDPSSLQIFGEKITKTASSSNSSRPSTAPVVNNSVEDDSNKETVTNTSTDNGISNNTGNKKAFDWWKERGIGIVNTNKGRPSTANVITNPSSNNRGSIASLRSPVSFRNAPPAVIEDMRNGINGQSIASLARPSSSGLLVSSSAPSSESVPATNIISPPLSTSSSTIPSVTTAVPSSLLSNTLLNGGVGLLAPSGPLGITGILNSSTAATDISTTYVGNNEESLSSVPPPSSSSKKRQQSLSSKYFADHPEVHDNTSNSRNSSAAIVPTTSSITTTNATNLDAISPSPAGYIFHDSAVRTGGFLNHRSSIGSDVSTATTVSALSQESIEPIRIDTSLTEMKSPMKTK